MIAGNAIDNVSNIIGYHLYPKLILGNHDNRENFKKNFPHVKTDQNGFVQYAENFDDKTFIFDAKIGLNDFFKVIELNDSKDFEEIKGDSESLAGFLLEVAKEFPKTGQKILFSKHQFIIELADKKGIKRIKVILP